MPRKSRDARRRPIPSAGTPRTEPTRSPEPPGHRPRNDPRSRWLPPIAGLVAIGLLAIAGYVALAGPGSAPGGATPWTTFGTRDVHSLAFVPGDNNHLFFGHHTGLLESRDGGRTWRPTGLSGADAMNVRPATGNVLQVAGHNIYLESTDGGKHWTSVPNDLPGLDLHAFTLDPADLNHAWAWSVGNGLFESIDQGRHWTPRQSGDWPVLAAVDVNGKAAVIGVSGRGLGLSRDGGQTWTSLADPGAQVASLAASADGNVLYAGTTAGLKRSDNAGLTWKATGFSGLALTVAMAASNTVALVDDGTRFFRSDDGGATFGPPR